MEKTEMKVWVTKAVGERILERRDLQKRNPEYLPKKRIISLPWVNPAYTCIGKDFGRLSREQPLGIWRDEDRFQSPQHGGEMLEFVYRQIEKP